MTSLEYYIEQVEQFISALTDDIESGEGTVVTQTKLAVYREVLEHLEEIEQEPCEDAISRQAVISTIYDNKSDFKNDFSQGFFADRIRELSPVTPQPKTGHWKYDYVSADGHRVYHCSECGCYLKPKHSEPLNSFKWCSLCGAKMDEPQESEEVYCNHTDAEIAKSFIEDVEAVKDLLPQERSGEE